jgi:hypothetical protein
MCLPCALARAMPAFTRSAISERSNSAKLRGKNRDGLPS